MNEHLCNKLGIYYVDKRTRKRNHLWKDGLDLVQAGKVLLANNLLPYLANNSSYTPGNYMKFWY